MASEDLCFHRDTSNNDRRASENGDVVSLVLSVIGGGPQRSWLAWIVFLLFYAEHEGAHIIHGFLSLLMERHAHVSIILQSIQLRF